MFTPAARLSVASRRDSELLTLQVQSLVSRMHTPPRTSGRRHERVALPILLQLTPLDASGEPCDEDAITIVGKDISQRGIAFFHDHPLPYRRAIVAVDHPQFGTFAAEVDIRWCRFARPGWYESGGRLVRAIASEPIIFPSGRASLAS